MRVVGRSMPAIIVLLLASVSWASAQGTMGTIADPMGLAETREVIERYVDVPSDRWEAIEAAHGRYLERVKALRDGAVTEFLADTQALWMDHDLAKIEAFCRQRKVLRKRASALDSALFEEIAVALPDSSIGLARARRARERASLTEGCLDRRWGDELITCALAHVTPEERPIVLDGLVAVEERLTKQLRELSDASADYEIELARKLAAANLLVVDPNELAEAEMNEYMEASGRIYSSVYEPLLIKGHGGVVMQAEALKALLPRLTPKSALNLRRAFCRQFYADISQPCHPEVERLAVSILRHRLITAEEATVVRGLFDQWLTAEWSLICEQMKLLDHRATRGEILYRAYPPSHEELMAPVEAVGEKRERVAVSARAAMTAMLGEERAADLLKLSDASASQLFRGKDEVALLAGSVVALEEPDQGDRWREFEPHVITPLDSDRDRIARVLELDEAGAVVLGALFADFVEAAEQVKQEFTNAQALSEFDHESNAPNRETLEKRKLVAAESVPAILGALNQMFDRTRAVLARGDQAALVEGLRGLTAIELGIGGEGDVPDVFLIAQGRCSSLTRAAARTRVTAEQERQLALLMSSRSEALVTAMQRRWEVIAGQLHARLEERLLWSNAQAALPTPDGNHYVLENRAISLRNRRKNTETRNEIRALSTEVFDRWVEGVDADTAARARREWNYESEPGVWIPDENVDHHVSNILRGGGLVLTDAEKLSIEEVALEWRAAYDSACQAMAGALHEFQSQPASDWMVSNKCLSDLIAARFVRDEASYRAMLRLQRILGVERARTVAGFDAHLKQVGQKTKGL